MAPLWSQAQGRKEKSPVDTSEITVKVITEKNKDSVIVTENGQAWVKASKNEMLQPVGWVSTWALPILLTIPIIPARPPRLMPRAQMPIGSICASASQ